MALEQLGYVVVETADLDAWDKFLVDVVGVMRADDPGGEARHYRIDARPFRFRIVKGEAERLLAAAYRVSSSDELDALRKRIEAFGQACDAGSEEEAALRGVDRYFATTDPAGNRLEFYCGDSTDDVPFESTQGVAGFVTGEMGMGHAVFGAPEFEKSHKFYREAVGFHDTDLPTLKFSPDPKDPGMRLAFMHADNGRHHSVAIGEHPTPPVGCVHLMLEMTSMDDVGRAYDRMHRAGVPESATLGRHVNDEVTGFYMKTPSGFDLEIGYGGLVLDPKTWSPTAHATISKWGHVWAWQKQAATAG